MSELKHEISFWKDKVKYITCDKKTCVYYADSKCLAKNMNYSMFMIQQILT